MNSYQYYLLDWDGNLARTLHIWLEVFRVVLEKRGIYKTDHEIAETFGKFSDYIELWDIKDGAEAHDEARLLARERLPEVELYPDALEVLEALHKAGKKLALITTSRHIYVDHLLEKYSIKDMFDVIIAGDDVTHHKPHPESLEKALAALGGTKEQAVMIGDSDKDLGAAKNFGIDSILFYPPEHGVFYKLETLKEHEPTYVVDDFTKILDTI